jgi:transcriptional regulator with XRE-family HTH domain
VGFGAELQRLRKAAGLSQSGLAGKAGVELRSVQNWEQGHRHPKPQAMLALAGALGVSVESLIRALNGTPGDRPRRRGKSDKETP